LGSALFHNIGTLLTGDINQPVSKATSVYVEDGLIKEVGSDRTDADTLIDVRGATLAPGLWDAHFHPYFGEYSPRVEGFQTITRSVRAGVTSIVSAGFGHQPGMYLPSEKLPNVQAHTSIAKSGRPELARDALGTKALTVVAMKSWEQVRPRGMKCFAGTVMAEDGMSEEDFIEMSEAGVQRLKFLRPVSHAKEAERYRQWAHDHGFKVLMHTGNRSQIKDVDDIGESYRVIQPDVASHINGGPTPGPAFDVDWFINETKTTLELVFIGNLGLSKHILKRAADRGELHRVTIGSDLPGGTGFIPGAILRTVQILSHLSDIPVEQLICMATGNTARNFGLPGGIVAPGQPADLACWDPVDRSETDTFVDCVAYGDRAYPGLIMVDGEIMEHGNPLLLDPKRPPTVTRKRA
jgi:enamidase